MANIATSDTGMRKPANQFAVPESGRINLINVDNLLSTTDRATQAVGNAARTAAGAVATGLKNLATNTVADLNNAAYRPGASNTPAPAGNGYASVANLNAASNGSGVSTVQSAPIPSNVWQPRVGDTAITARNTSGEMRAEAQAPSAPTSTGNGYVSTAYLRENPGADYVRPTTDTPSTQPTTQPTTQPATQPATQQTQPRVPSATPSGTAAAGNTAAPAASTPAAPARGNVVTPEGYTLTGYDRVQAPELRAYQAQTDQIGRTYDAARDAQLMALENQYNMSRAQNEQSAARIPEAYRQQAVAAEQQAARDRLAFNESAAASGLNVGAGSQAQLAQNAALQGNLASIGTARANAQTEAEFQLMQMEQQYQNAVAEAVANNEYDRARALMQEYQREQQSIVDNYNQRAMLDYEAQMQYAQDEAERANRQAELDYNIRQQNQSALEQRAATLAQYGDFSGYGDLGYSEAEQAAMRQAWIAQNPDLAVAMGYTPRRSRSYGSSTQAYDQNAAQNAYNQLTDRQRQYVEAGIAQAEQGNPAYLQNIVANMQRNGTAAASPSTIANVQAAQQFIQNYLS